MPLFDMLTRHFIISRAMLITPAMLAAAAAADICLPCRCCLPLRRRHAMLFVSMMLCQRYDYYAFSLLRARYARRRYASATYHERLLRDIRYAMLPLRFSLLRCHADYFATAFGAILRDMITYATTILIFAATMIRQRDASRDTPLPSTIPTSPRHHADVTIRLMPDFALILRFRLPRRLIFDVAIVSLLFIALCFAMTMMLLIFCMRHAALSRHTRCYAVFCHHEALLLRH